MPDPATVGYGFDFNPSADRVRVVTNTGLNFRINPANGAPIDGNTGTPGTNLDAAINGLPGGSTGLSAAAYTNSYGQDAGGPTTLYVLDPASNKLFIQNPPNNGVLTNGLDVTVNGAPLDFSEAALDIHPSVHVDTANAPATGKAYAVLNVGGGNNLYTIDLSTGEATLIGANVFDPGVIFGLAIGDSPPPSTSTTILSSANPALVTDTITLTANVVPASATGTVTFALPGTSTILPGCDARPVTAGTASCTVTLAAGLSTIIAGFSGDAFDAPSASLSLLQLVNLIPTTTTLTVNPNPANPGQTVTLTVTVTPASVSGSVLFAIDDIPVNTAQLSGGQATFTTSTLTPGSHAVQAAFLGSTTFANSFSTIVPLQVLFPGPLT